MDAEDLDSPLRGGPRREPRRPWTLPRILACWLGLGAVALTAWILLVDDPLGGEPVATAFIERRLAPPEGVARPAPEPELTTRDGVPVVSPGDPMPTTGPVIIRVPGSGGSVSAVGGGPAETLPSLIEASKYGPLPRIAPDGTRPSDRYARPAAVSDKPQVAILVTGLGLASGPTADAIGKLPATVTLGFNPYAADLERWLGEARRNGHETMLLLPLEPYDYPADDPGPQTLLTSLPAEANLDRLRWVMGRATGYVGLATYMGAKFTASEEALAPVLTESARRGLALVDAASGPKSLVQRLGADMGLLAARAEAVLDASPDAGHIDAELVRLEQTARDRGSAVGIATSAVPTLARIAAWTEGLEQRGLVLVPVSAVARQRLGKPVVGAR